MWNESKTIWALSPERVLANRRLYASVKKGVKAVFQKGSLVLLAVFAAVFLKCIWAVGSLLFSYGLIAALPGPSVAFDLGASLGRAIPWLFSAPPGIGWLVAGAGVAWFFARR